MAQIKVNQYSIPDDAITLAKMASGTDGNIITYDASGNPAVVASGTSGHFLKSQGADTVPVFAAAGGGILLKREVTLITTLTTVTGTSTTSYTDTGLTASITTSETDSTVTCEFSQFFAMTKSATGHAIGFVRLLVDYDSAGYAEASKFGAYLYDGLTITGRLRGPGSLCGAWTTPTKPSGTVVSFKTQFYLYNIAGGSASIYAQSDYMKSTMILTELSTT
jgi:hypothetical protein